MTISSSDKINQWFNINCEGDRSKWFWKFIEETEPYDSVQQDGDYPDELMERGYWLGKRAAEADRGVYQVSGMDIEHEDYLAVPDYHYYFIGQETEVLNLLQVELDNWLEENPQGTEEEKRQSQLKRQLKNAEQDLRNKESDVKFFRHQLASEQLDLEASQSEFGSFHTYFHMAVTAKTEKIVTHYLRKALSIGSQNSGMMQTYINLVEDFLKQLHRTSLLNHGIKLEHLLPFKPAPETTS